MKKPKLFQFTEKERDFIYGFLLTMFCFALLLFAALLSGCSTHANANIPEKELVLQQDTAKLRSILRAYNHVLHRIWIDRPNYVEDVLVEMDEFCELEEALDGDFGDTFEFYSAEDSIAYHINWEYEGENVVHVIKHICVQPDEPSKQPIR